MKNLRFPLFCVLIALLINPALAEESSEDKQARLDEACETARHQKLAPMRKQVIDTCVANKELPDQEECERFYADYGERTGHKAALFYDLPECITAFNFNQGNQDQN